MSPADAPGADWRPPLPESADMRRLEQALDRISAAQVRLAERHAASVDEARVLPGAVPPLDEAAVEELRRRLDKTIARVRAVLDETAN